MSNDPKNFLWGVATSAYQIEGAHNLEGRTPSIWDTFSHIPGRIHENQNGDLACNHYQLWEQDVDLMKSLGINAYRFSLSWSRIFPENSKDFNTKGLDFYQHLIDKLLQVNIKPFVTMYHWDLPQYLQDRGGWATRETAERFRDYAYFLVEKLGDRVSYWTTINEPSVVAYAGYYKGVHAPGIQSTDQTLKTIHHLLLAHGLAVHAIRSRFNVKLGITLNLSPVYPDHPSSAYDQKAAHLYDSYVYRSFLDALYLKKYPEEMDMQEVVKLGDMEIIGAPTDYLGVNYYTKTTVCFEESQGLIQARVVPPIRNAYSNLWDFYPQGLSEVLERVWNNYQPPEIYVLENGTSLDEEDDDQGRIAYIRAHLSELSRCIKQGMKIQGYFYWSFMDNFEWAYGYSKRFGLFHVDFKTLERIPRASARWYAHEIAQNKDEGNAFT